MDSRSTVDFYYYARGINLKSVAHVDFILKLESFEFKYIKFNLKFNLLLARCTFNAPSSS